MKDEQGYEGVWRTIKGARIFIRTGETLDSALERHNKYKYQPENVNDYFEKIETYDQLQEFREDYREKIEFYPDIVPKKYLGMNNIKEWVEHIEKIDDKTIRFKVLSEDIPYPRKAKSSIKNFVKNYKVHME